MALGAAALRRIGDEYNYSMAYAIGKAHRRGRDPGDNEEDVLSARDKVDGHHGGMI
jgi:hypothetical protein